MLMVRAQSIGLLLAVFTAGAQGTGAPSLRRIAVVISNTNYTKLPPIPNVNGGVGLIGERLRDAGFEVHIMQNVTDFIPAERMIRESLRPGDVCLVYYSGYAVGTEYDNFLLPVNFDPRSNAEIEVRAYHFKRLQQTLDNQHVALKIFILDTSPQIDPGVGDVGLMEPQIGDSSEMLYVSAMPPGRWIPATSERSTGLLTQALVKFIPERGLALVELFDKVKREVGLSSGGAQIPYVLSTVVMQDFYFHEPVKVTPTLPDPVVPPAAPTWPRSGIPVVNRIDREEYLWVPAATFRMGCAPGDARCKPEEKPQHPVRLTHGFWIGRNEVQVESFARYVTKVKAHMPPAPLFNAKWRISDHPIVNVSWEEAASYCANAGGRLPTEAEWEYAARGGVSDKIYPMSGEEDSRDKANFDGTKGNDIYDFIAPVRKFDPNNYGLYDMAGNAWEWVSDWFSPSYFAESPEVDPSGPAQGKQHVIRGGSFNSDPNEHLRISFRMGASKFFNSIGFRCAIDDTPESRKALPEPKIQ
jgi:formylglycine-generating enzyme required for sulfatase activity